MNVDMIVYMSVARGLMYSRCNRLKVLGEVVFRVKAGAFSLYTTAPRNFKRAQRVHTPLEQRSRA